MSTDLLINDTIIILDNHNIHKNKKIKNILMFTLCCLIVVGSFAMFFDYNDDKNDKLNFVVALCFLSCIGCASLFVFVLLKWINSYLCMI